MGAGARLAHGDAQAHRPRRRRNHALGHHGRVGGIRAAEQAFTKKPGAAGAGGATSKRRLRNQAAFPKAVDQVLGSAAREPCGIEQGVRLKDQLPAALYL